MGPPPGLTRDENVLLSSNTDYSSLPKVNELTPSNVEDPLQPQADTMADPTVVAASDPAKVDLAVAPDSPAPLTKAVVARAYNGIEVCETGEPEVGYLIISYNIL